jgi:cytochrome P450 family 6
MGFTEILLYLILPAAVAIYFFFQRKFSYFSELGIPHIKATSPLGSLGGVGTKFHMFDMVKNIYNECKGKDVICGFYSFVQPIFVVIDPELAKTMMVKDFNFFVNRGQFVDEEKQPLTGKRLKNVLKIIFPTFLKFLNLGFNLKFIPHFICTHEKI